MLIHIHIPKNAGTTIHRILKDNFGERCSDYREFYNFKFNSYSTSIDSINKDPIPLLESDFVEYINQVRVTADVVTGHNIIPYSPEISARFNLKYFTFIRHPIARTISLYNYEREKFEKLAKLQGKKVFCSLPFEEYIIHKRAVQNWQTYSLTGDLNSSAEDAIAKLDNFLMVGVVDKFFQSLIVLREAIRPIKNLDISIGSTHFNETKEKTVIREKLTLKEREKILEQNQEDLKLYEYAVSRLLKDSEKISSSLLIDELSKTQRQLSEATQEIKAMKSSKFWKIRSQWFSIKHSLRPGLFHSKKS